MFGEFDVAILHAIDTFGAAEIVTFGELLAEIGVEQIFDLGFRLIAEFEAVWAKKLDAVVVERLCEAKSSSAEVGAHRARQHTHGRRWNWAGHVLRRIK